MQLKNVAVDAGVPEQDLNDATKKLDVIKLIILQQKRVYMRQQQTAADKIEIESTDPVCFYEVSITGYQLN